MNGPAASQHRTKTATWHDKSADQIECLSRCMTQVIADGQKKRSEAWSQINRLISEAKRQLGEKYKAAF